MSAVAVSRNLMPEKRDIPQPSLSRSAKTSWGDEFKAAYLQAKRYFEPGAVTYEAVAERVSQLVPVSHTSILRLGYAEEIPERPSHRQMAYLALVAMGYDPTEFGLKPEDRALKGYTEIEVRKLLDPGHLGFGPSLDGHES